jgi:hypothetical protein
VILVCLIAGVALLVPRLQPARQPAMTLPAVETPTLPAVNLQAATETPPAIVEVTDALDKGAGDMTLVPTMDPNAPATATPVAPALTPATGTTPSGEVVTATAGVLEQTATAPAAPTATPTDTHPAVAVVGDLNAQLPRFYRGEVDVQAIQEHWTGEALRSVVGFGTLRLPRAMQIRPDQRNTLEATYVYRNGPTLTRETRDGAIATSREYWRYSTSANATEICETRDYVYSLVRVDGKYKVSEFSSRLVDSGCSQ